MTLKDLKEAAERTANGDLVYDHQWKDDAGRTQTKYINLTTMLSPGLRKTSDYAILVAEAEMAAEGNPPDNPAHPANQATHELAVKALERKGLDRAWTDSVVTEYPSRDGGGR